ncbi:LUD domain-containing protein [Rugosimonospora acidiphila]|uniref:LUD domain-containing protein n=1 Tax=Rugosimonospora acidiphila TaxID=556531 RepID=A0ABP9S345_9ACTN
MTDAKQEILARIRAALGDHPTPPPVPRDYRRALPDGTDLVAMFAELAADYRATITRTPAAELPAAIARAAAGRRLAVPAGIPADWIAGLSTLPDDPPLTNEQLDQVDGVLTGAAAAIALSGTIILDAGPEQGRRALTLLPDYHLCVVRTDQIVGTAAEALERLDPRRPQTWISGPSATSDIELNRVEGVHGPRTLHVLIAE